MLALSANEIYACELRGGKTIGIVVITRIKHGVKVLRVLSIQVVTGAIGALISSKALFFFLLRDWFELKYLSKTL